MKSIYEAEKCVLLNDSRVRSAPKTFAVLMTIALDVFLQEKGNTINGMVALEVSEDLLVARLLKRGETSGRPDDQDENKIRNRFSEYENKTAILKHYYEDQNKYYGVEGVGSIEEITERLSAVFDKL